MSKILEFQEFNKNHPVYRYKRKLLVEKYKKTIFVSPGVYTIEHDITIVPMPTSRIGRFSDFNVTKKGEP
jgi:hypothetical protein